MAYYSGNDPASQYNQSDANSLQQRQLKRKRLGQALTGTEPTVPDEPMVRQETPEAPVSGNGTQRMIRSISDSARGMGQPASRAYRQPNTDSQDLFNQNRTGSAGASSSMSPAGTVNPLQAAVSGQSAQTNPLDGIDRSQWNTEGWATPEYLGKAAGGAMAGWDQTNWDDQNMQTPKYVVGRILSNYSPTIEGLGQAMAEIQQAYPGAEFDGKDKVTIPGLGTIDMLVNAGGEGGSWAWQDLTNDPGGSPLQTAVLGSAGETMNPTQSILDGFDPALLQDPQWRQLLKSLGVNI